MEPLHTLAFVLVVIAVTVLPVMVAAKWARARRSGFLPALGAVLLATFVSQLALVLVDHALIALALAFVAGCTAYALVLGTSFVAAVGIAIVSLALQVGMLVALVALGLQLPAVVSVSL